MRNLLFITTCMLLLSNCEQDYDSDYSDSVLYEESYDESTTSGEQYEDYGENPFIDVNTQAVSTFGVDADGGSYANMRRFSSYNQRPPISAIRIEEFLNYFNYDYPQPETGNVGLTSESFTCPWNEEHYLLRIGMKGKALETLPPSNFVFLIDVSGSMSSADKLSLLKEGFIEYVNQIDATDKVAIISYAGSSKVVLESTYGDNKTEIIAAINSLVSVGSTAGAEGIVTAYEIAEQNFIAGGNNRIIMASDGDFNVGPTSTEELVDLITKKRDTGIYLTVLGVGSGNYNDAMMEQIANNGNGTYEYIDNSSQINKVFNYEYEKLFTVAKDCKIQITFNENAVSSYRLIGYENRVLANEDFNNDTVDSGEIGASQTITALYELVPVATNEETNIGTIDFRYKYPIDDESVEISLWVDNSITNFNLASENSRFAAAVAGFAMELKESAYKGELTLSSVYTWAENASTYDPFGFRSEFIEIVTSYQ